MRRVLLISVFFMPLVVAIILPGCKPPFSQSQACFTLYTVGQSGQRVDSISTAKVGETVYADVSCSKDCTMNKDVNWGDGYWGEYMTHIYYTPGTYTVKYSCDKAHSHRKKHRKTSSFVSYKSEATKIITITQ